MSHEAKRQKVEFVLSLLRKGLATSAIYAKTCEKWGKIPNRTIDTYIEAAKALLQAEHANILHKVDESIAERANAIVGDIWGKYEIVADLQNEISELKALIKKGYIYRAFTVTDEESGVEDVIEIKEGFGVAEIEKLNKLCDSKRNEICKLLGYYSPDKVEQIVSEIKVAREMTPEERKKKIQELENM